LKIKFGDFRRNVGQAERFDEWQDSSDEGEAAADGGEEALPHVLRAAAEQKGVAQAAHLVSVGAGDEERWLRMPPLPYLRHGAEDHTLSRYVDAMAVVCGERPAPLLAPLAQPGPLPLAPRPPARTATNPDVFEACRAESDGGSEDSPAQGGAIGRLWTWASGSPSSSPPPQSPGAEPEAKAAQGARLEKLEAEAGEPEPEPQPEPEPEPAYDVV